MKKLLPKTVFNPSGFTLIELLVVVSIIAVLSVIGITIFTGVQKNVREARRKADIDAISKALEAGYTSGSTIPYPALTDSMFSGGIIPKDPNGSSYVVTGTLPGATYCACAVLETSTAGNFGAACAAGTSNYCLKNQQ